MGEIDFRGTWWSVTTVVSTSDGVEYLTSEYEYRKKIRVRVLILKNVLEYEYRKKFEYEYFYKFSKRSFLVVTAQNLSQKHKRIRFFSVSGMLRRRSTASSNFLTSYSQNYCYILNKLGTLTLKASARFLARRKKPLACRSCKLLIVARSSVAAAEKCLTLKLSKELT